MAFDNYTSQDWQNWYNQAKGLGWDESKMSSFVAEQTGTTYSPESIASKFGSTPVVGGTTPGMINSPYSPPKAYEAPQVTNDPSKSEWGTIFTNKPGTGLNADGSLQEGYQYGSYVDGKGVGTPSKIGSPGVGGQITQAPSAAPAQTGNVVVGGTAPPAPTGLINSQSTTRPSSIQPNLNQGIDYNTSTIEGRVANLLDQNNRVIQQAGNRARAAFAKRGLLNSSMAEEAAMEAMTTKAIEIAGPDAAAYLKQSQLNQDWTNKFAQGDREQGYKMETMDRQGQIDINKIAAEYGFRNTASDKESVAKLQTNYIQAIDGINNNHSTMINAINQMDATPEEKQAMITNATTARTSAISFTNAAFKRLPGWSNDWLISETPTTQAGTPVNETPATPAPAPAPTPTTTPPQNLPGGM